jgi:hypothetical protein
MLELTTQYQFLKFISCSSHTIQNWYFNFKTQPPAYTRARGDPFVLSLQICTKSRRRNKLSGFRTSREKLWRMSTYPSSCRKIYRWNRFVVVVLCVCVCVCERESERERERKRERERERVSEIKREWKRKRQKQCARKAEPCVHLC